jgi:hypothetical protein
MFIAARFLFGVVVLVRIARFWPLKCSLLIAARLLFGVVPWLEYLVLAIG